MSEAPVQLAGPEKARTNRQGSPPSSSAVAQPPVEAEGLRRAYAGVAGPPLDVLRGVSLAVDRGEAVAITGASGAGKSTLLHLLGALDRPTGGSVRIGGTDTRSLDDGAAAELRNRRIGFVFQFHHLLREFTALENVMMPALVGGESEQAARAKSSELLAQVGLADRSRHKPAQLSGGEQQRVAVARALVNQPLVVLADEPTGNLDPRTSEGVHDILFGLKARREVALVVVTHNRDLASRAERVLQLREGVLEDV